ncbi:hypothetical protein INT43_005164 [Umbelopsis isabellina]|uniref:Alginate lyase domain-containing protein n=1 Tax=Mortierella isabellina TaxID=91625 RepID=A0A8H7PGU9_MORIS|nr:hypothetical protein INT43_005164 [Umbelopsis isabellina]
MFLARPILAQDAAEEMNDYLDDIDDSEESEGGEPGSANGPAGYPSGGSSAPSPSPASPENPAPKPSTSAGAPVPTSTRSIENIGGWAYPAPQAREPTDDIPDGVFPFVRMKEDDLQRNKLHKDDPDQGLQTSLWYLKTKCDRYVKNDTVFSVVNKAINAPSNSSHDYMSLARYFWPDDKQPDGLPYKRVDGHVNPEIKTVPDYNMFREMVKHVQFLSLGYYYFDNEAYAERAIRHVHAWFLDPKTRMNPHLQYASIIRGYQMGRAKGIIDFSVVPDLLDSIAILQHAKAWPPRMSAGLRVWFALYAEWLWSSPNGYYEKTAHNNHGTYYDVQQIAISHFLGQDAKALQVAQNATSSRIAQQILSSGEQYFETDRPFSWFYSIFNLRGMFQLAEMAEHVNIDLWNYQTVDGKSIKNALDYLLPSAINNTLWEFSNTQGFAASAHLVEVLQKAYIVYGSPEYYKLSRMVGDQHGMLYNVTRLTMSWDSMKDEATNHVLTTSGKKSAASIAGASGLITMALVGLTMFVPAFW